MSMSKGKPHKILVVDDEPDVEPLVLQRMRRKIRSGLYTFVFAHNGIEALERLREDDEIEMVLSDINMPRMDGLTLLEQIPKVDPELRAVIISAYGDMENIRTAMNRGAFDFVTKPIDFEDLEITVERTLNHIAEWRDALASRDRLVAIQNELDVASDMQQSILPTTFPKGSDYQIFGNMEAARNVGGDFFDVIRLDDDHIGLSIADVSGKGVPAALFMMSSRTLMKGAAIGSTSPSEVLREVNDMLSQDNDAGMFVTILYAEYDPRERKTDLRQWWTQLAAPRPCRRKFRAAPTDRRHRPGTGARTGVRAAHHQPCAGDTVLLYTDGVTEAMNADEEEFGNDRLHGIFASAPPNNSEEANNAVFHAVHAFAGDAAQSDDITCLTLCRRELED